MLILDRTEIQYHSVEPNQFKLNKSKIVGFTYRNRLFIPVKAYRDNQLKQAIKHCRKLLTNNKLFLILLKEQTAYLICLCYTSN